MVADVSLMTPGAVGKRVRILIVAIRHLSSCFVSSNNQEISERGYIKQEKKKAGRQMVEVEVCNALWGSTE